MFNTYYSMLIPVSPFSKLLQYKCKHKTEKSSAILLVGLQNMQVCVFCHGLVFSEANYVMSLIKGLFCAIKSPNKTHRLRWVALPRSARTPRTPGCHSLQQTAQEDPAEHRQVEHLPEVTGHLQHRTFFKFILLSLSDCVLSSYSLCFELKSKKKRYRWPLGSHVQLGWSTIPPLHALRL